MNSILEKIGRFCRNTLLVTLSFFMCANVLYTDVFAYDDDFQDSYVLNKTNDNDIDYDDIAYELTSKREGNKRYFKMNDGSTISCVYDHTVAIQDDNGDYQLIDNRLTTSNNNVSVNFLSENNHCNSVVLTLSNSSDNLQAQLVDESNFNEINDNDNSDCLVCSDSISEIVQYNNVYENVDQQYQIVGEDTINRIVLKDDSCSDSYLFYFAGYDVSLSDGYILLVNEESKTYYIDSIYAYDSNGDHIKADVEVVNNNISISIDEDWLSDSGRSYPVTINATVSKYLYGNSVENITVISSRANSSEMYGYGAIWVGKEASSYGICKAAIKFDLPSISEEETVIAAHLSLYQMGFRGNGINDVMVSTLTEETNFRTLTYNKLNNIIGQEYDYIRSSHNSNDQRFDVDITNIVSDWYENDDNYGLVFYSDDTSSYRYTTFTSFSHPTYYSQYPYIVISTISNSGLNDYFSYQTVGSDSLGSVYDCINNGKLTYIYNDFSDNGNYLPLSISHVYDSINRDEESDHGLGFRLNVDLEVSRKDEYTYQFTNETGSKEYFNKESSDTYLKEYDNSVVLKVNSDDISIIDADLTYLFDKSSGKITKIIDDINSKYQSFIYDDENRLIEIIDGANRSTYFYYNSSDLLSKIVYDQDKEINYSYDSLDRLIKVTTDSGIETNLTYDSNFYLTSISNSVEGKIEVSYDEDDNKVEEIKRYNKANELKERVSFEYFNYKTNVTYLDGYKLRYQFDDRGHTVCVSDDKGYSYYYGYGSGNNIHNIKSRSLLQSNSENLIVSSFYDDSTITNDNSHCMDVHDSLSQRVDVEENESYTLSFKAKGKYGVVTIGDKDFNLEDISDDEYQQYSFTYVNDSDDQIIVKIENEDINREPDIGIIDPPITEEETNSNVDDSLYVTEVKFEKTAVANRSSLVTNGNFNDTSYGWNNSSIGIVDNESFMIIGDISTKKEVYQVIDHTGSSKDKIVISYSAIVDGLLVKSDREIGVKVELLDEDDDVKQSEVYYVSSLDEDKQYIAGSLVSKVNYSKIKVTLMMNYQKGTVTYDDVNLYLDSFNEEYSYDDNGNEIVCIDTNSNKVESYYKKVNGKDKLDHQLYYKANSSEYSYKLSYSYDDKGQVVSQTLTNYNVLETDDNRITTIEYHYDSNSNLEYTSRNGIKKYESGKIRYSDNYLSSYESETGDIAYFNYDDYGHLLSVTDGNSNTTYYQYDDNGSVSKIIEGSKVIEYSYNLLGQVVSINNNQQNIYSYTYDDDNLLVSIKLNDITIKEYEYDELGNLISDGDNDYSYDSYYRLTNIEDKCSYYYSTDSKIGLVVDELTDKTTRYTYDLSDKLTSVIQKDGIKSSYQYDSEGRLISNTFTYPDITSTVNYQYDPLELLEKENISTNSLEYSLNYERDYLLRTDSITYKEEQDDDTILTVNYSYKNVGKDKTSNVVTRYENIFDSDEYWDHIYSYDYSYDPNGNISEVVFEDVETSSAVDEGDIFINTASIIIDKDISELFKKRVYYHYDKYNQLIREDNKLLNKTITYEYDLLGNIVSKKEYAYTTSEEISEDTLITSNTYLYQDSNDKTKLTSVNGQAIVYNSDGLIEDYYGDISLTYDAENRIREVEIESSSYYYEYDVKGNRISKSNDQGEYRKYLYDDEGKLIVEENYLSIEEVELLLNKVIYEYDSNDSPVSFVYESYDREGEVNSRERYYYLKDLTNDIVAILNEDSQIIAEYYYDGYGNCTIETNKYTSDIATVNHLRYRGYYLDDETGFYYLSSRYYDPSICRFISQDEIEYLGASATTVSYNLYAYCLNDPINNSDSSGNLSIPNWAKVVIGVAAIAVGVISTAIVGGAVSVAVIASLKLSLSSAIVSSLSNAIVGGATHLITNKSIKGLAKTVIQYSIDGFCDGFMWGGITSGLSLTLAAANKIRLEDIGKLKPDNKKGDGYFGVKYGSPKRNGNYSYKSLEIHSPHSNGPHNYWHFQQNTWSFHNETWSITSKSRYWRIFK